MKIRQREIYLTNAPFADYSKTKFRPVIVISNNKYNKNNENVIVCVVTTNISLPYEVIITNQNLERGKLLMDSAIRCDGLFRLEGRELKKRIGRTKKEIHCKTVGIINEILMPNPE